MSIDECLKPQNKRAYQTWFIPSIQYYRGPSTCYPKLTHWLLCCSLWLLIWMSNEFSHLHCVIYQSNIMRTGPIEMFSFAEPNTYIKIRSGWPAPNCEFNIDFVAESRDPITPSGGAKVLASKTFDEVKDKQYDILFVPGGKSSTCVCTSFLITYLW